MKISHKYDMMESRPGFIMFSLQISFTYVQNFAEMFNRLHVFLDAQVFHTVFDFPCDLKHVVGGSLQREHNH